MATIPDFRAQGLITSDHDLGAAMSQRPRLVPELRGAGAEGQSAAESEHHDRRRLREGTEPAI